MSSLPDRSLDPRTERDSFNSEALDYYGRLRRVRERLEQNISNPLSTADAARIAGLNPSYFSTFFHDKVGLRFSAWSRRVRIERAMTILDSESCSIREVARRVGYRGQRAFERAFKRQTSMTPSRFRRRKSGL